MFKKIILPVFLILSILAVAACSLAPLSDKVLLTAEWKMAVMFMTNGDYELFSDNIVSLYTNGVLSGENTNTYYRTYLLNSNNTCAFITYNTDGTTLLQSGYWSISPGAKTFTMTVSNITNVTIATNIIVAQSWKFYYSIINNNLRIVNESDKIVYSMMADLPVHLTTIMDDQYTLNGISYIDFVKK